jgi:hypothetical protein
MNIEHSASNSERRIKNPRGGRTLNEEYRNGGDIVEDREGGERDLVGDMMLARKRPDVLANALRRMGVTSTGDDCE